jgi:hypothetical protein
MRNCFFTIIFLLLKTSIFSQHREKEFICFYPVNTEAYYPGGDKAFNKFITKKIIVPQDLPDSNFTPRGLIEFVIFKDGSVGDFKIIRKAGYQYDEEIIRVLKLTRWKPGLMNGRPVNSYRTLPYILEIAAAEVNDLAQNKCEGNLQEMPPLKIDDLPCEQPVL